MTIDPIPGGRDNSKNIKKELITVILDTQKDLRVRLFDQSDLETLKIKKLRTIANRLDAIYPIQQKADERNIGFPTRKVLKIRDEADFRSELRKIARSMERPQQLEEIRRDLPKESFSLMTPEARITHLTSSILSTGAAIFWLGAIIFIVRLILVPAPTLSFLESDPRQEKIDTPRETSPPKVEFDPIKETREFEREVFKNLGLTKD